MMSVILCRVVLLLLGELVRLKACVGRQPTVYGLSERRSHAIPILWILTNPF